LCGGCKDVPEGVHLKFAHVGLGMFLDELEQLVRALRCNREEHRSRRVQIDAGKGVVCWSTVHAKCSLCVFTHLLNLLVFGRGEVFGLRDLAWLHRMHQKYANTHRG
jgi:hypothetical protein